MDLVIFGAQGIALGAYHAIHNCCPKRNIRCFLVSELGENASVLAGIPVVEMAVFAGKLSQEEKENLEVLIATPENVMHEIEQSLEQYGFCCHVRLDSLRWAELMSHYYSYHGAYKPLASLPVGFHKANIRVYMAKCHKDKPLHKEYNWKEWVTPIQVGAALCQTRVADLLDCCGEGISEKNGNYSELTGLYWIWKNRLCTEDYDVQYYGLVHYRRMLILSDDDILRLVDNKVDVVLPYPMLYEPSIEAHHQRYLREPDWEVMLAALQKLHPEYAKVFPQILKQQYFYNYNMILARKEILLEYCNWLFPILEQIEQTSEPKGRERSDRYIGYMGETLATLYFMYHRDTLHITHAECRLLL